MSYQFNISDIGLRLIKAYEGYWPEARPLMTGGQVVGFGHRVESDEALSLTEDEAEEVLKADLQGIEDLINSRVHASMTQSQFDALCSLVFSIGEEAFLSSNMLHALNQGQVLEAANEFDLWRKGNVEGRIYVVDALVRRRTAEKALFLRPTQRIARAPRFELAPVRDGGWNPTTETSQAALQTAPRPAQNRTRPQANRAPQAEQRTSMTSAALAAAPSQVIYADEIADNSLDELTLQPLSHPESNMSDSMVSAASNVDPADISVADLLDDVSPVPADDYVASTEETSSPIAEAAAAVSERLDALIDDNTPSPQPGSDEAWPDNLITSSITPVDGAANDMAQLADSNATTNGSIDELQQDDAMREQIARESQYNLDRYENYVDMPEDPETNRSLFIYGAMIVVGLMSALFGFFVSMRGSANVLGESGPFISIAAMLLGSLLVVVGGLYLMKLLYVKE